LDYQCENTEIEADHGRIKQILLGLMTNAIKFTEVGYVKVIAKLE
jgi:signal transduction histidine kinase